MDAASATACCDKTPLQPYRRCSTPHSDIHAAEPVGPAAVEEMLQMLALLTEQVSGLARRVDRLASRVDSLTQAAQTAPAALPAPAMLKAVQQALTSDHEAMAALQQQLVDATASYVNSTRLCWSTLLSSRVHSSSSLCDSWCTRVPPAVPVTLLSADSWARATVYLPAHLEVGAMPCSSAGPSLSCSNLTVTKHTWLSRSVCCAYLSLHLAA